MVSRTITDNADDLADAVASAGRRAGAQTRDAGASAAEAVERGSAAGATGVRRAARRGAEAYEAAADEFEERADTLEATIRRNPLAAAGAALLVGVVLGRFVL